MSNSPLSPGGNYSWNYYNDNDSDYDCNRFYKNNQMDDDSDYYDNDDDDVDYCGDFQNKGQQKKYRQKRQQMHEQAKEIKQKQFNKLPLADQQFNKWIPYKKTIYLEYLKLAYNKITKKFNKQIIEELMSQYLNQSQNFKQFKIMNQLHQIQQYTCGMPIGVFYIFRQGKFTYFDEEPWKQDQDCGEIFSNKSIIICENCYNENIYELSDFI